MMPTPIRSTGSPPAQDSYEVGRSILNTLSTQQVVRHMRCPVAISAKPMRTPATPIPSSTFKTHSSGAHGIQHAPDLTIAVSVLVHQPRLSTITLMNLRPAEQGLGDQKIRIVIDRGDHEAPTDCGKNLHEPDGLPNNASFAAQVLKTQFPQRESMTMHRSLFQDFIGPLKIA